MSAIDGPVSSCNSYVKSLAIRDAVKIPLSAEVLLQQQCTASCLRVMWRSTLHSHVQSKVGPADLPVGSTTFWHLVLASSMPRMPLCIMEKPAKGLTRHRLCA